MLGLCCQYIIPIQKRTKIEYHNLLEEKHLQYNKYLKNEYSQTQIKNVWLNNLFNLLNILDKLHAENFKLFRISSNLLPLAEPEVSLFDDPEIINVLTQIGNKIKNLGMRVSTHPDQFVVLSSNNDNVIGQSVTILDRHCKIFDLMGLTSSVQYPVNIHGGKKGNLTKLVTTINNLPDHIKNRLTLENDEFSYDIEDLYKVYMETGVPIVFDSHHHSFNGKLTAEKALELSMSTWGNIKPITHLSNTNPADKDKSITVRRKHSDYVHYWYEPQLEMWKANKIDIEMEFKMKNLAIKKAIQDFNL